MISSSRRWLERNLFASALDTFLTMITIPIVLWITVISLSWALETAHWSVISQSIKVLMVGIYPDAEIWRAWCTVGILGFLCGSVLGLVFQLDKRILAWTSTTVAVLGLIAFRSSDLLSALPFVACGMITLMGWWSVGQWPKIRIFIPAFWTIGLIVGLIVLARPGMNLWGGLLLSVLLTAVTATLSLPIGVLLAFGRRSRVASVKIICTAYIEVVRSVPLILVVYCVWILAPVLITGFRIPDITRGAIGFSLFFSAYVAEFIRSGLQAIPVGQGEAARSLGLNELDVNRYIIVPQALRVVIPGLVGNVLDIFNAAPLVFIIGITDFLRSGQMILADPQNGGNTYEVYVFLFVVYFIVGSLITFVARQLEFRMARGTR
jgi:general L-amino acid transport system permease protein